VPPLSPHFFLSLCSVSTRDAEGWGNCTSSVFTAEKVDGVGDERSGDTTTANVEALLETILENSQT